MTTVLLRLVLTTEMSKTISTNQPQHNNQQNPLIHIRFVRNFTFRDRQQPPITTTVRILNHAPSNKWFRSKQTKRAGPSIADRSPTSCRAKALPPLLRLAQQLRLREEGEFSSLPRNKL
ncbi:hypothetical protein CBL_09502 [Carabus blaptoides fortunei]